MTNDPMSADAMCKNALRLAAGAFLLSAASLIRSYGPDVAKLVAPVAQAFGG